MSVNEAVGPNRFKPAHSGVRMKTIALPAEHGGWGLLFEPVALGLLVAPSIAGFYLALSAVGFFLARHPLTLAVLNRRRDSPRAAPAKRFAALYLFAGISSLIAAIVFSRNSFILPLLIAAPLAGLQLAHDWTGRRRVLLSELSGAIAISSLATAMALTGGWSSTAAFVLWGIMIARGLPAILYVRVCLARLHHRPATSLPMLSAHGVALVAVVFLMRAGLAPQLAVAAMLILLIRTVISFAAGGLIRLTPKHLGFSEMGFGALTVLTVVIGYKFGI